MKRYITLFSMIIVLLAGCSGAAATMASPPKPTVSVNVHGVNYTGDPFRYVIVEEKNPSNQAGGEHVGPYNGGGIMCCFTLPKHWKPGLRVKVHSTHWLKKDAKGKLPEVNKVYALDLPPYPDGKVGELWVLRTSEGGIEVVMSDVEPDQPEWPGKVKGWPEPSLAFQREQWELHRKHAETYVSTFQKALEEIQSGNGNNLNDEWELDKKYHAEEVAKFSGPLDPRYREYKKQGYIASLKLAKDNLDQILKTKP